MPARSLVDLCLRVVISNLNQITSVANLPEAAVHEILKAVRTSDQLRQLEISSDIYDITAIYWQRLIRKKFPSLEKEHNWKPTRLEDWHKVFKKYSKAQQQGDMAAIEALTQTLKKEDDKKDSRKATIITRPGRGLPPLPKDGRGVPWGGAGRGQPRCNSASLSLGLNFGSGSRTKGNNENFLKKARREAKEDHNRRRLGLPQIGNPLPAGTIRAAPVCMVNQKRIERRPDIAPPPNTIRVPQPMGISQRDKEMQEREARLRKIKNSSLSQPASKANLISFSDDEDQEDDHLEENSGSANTPPVSQGSRMNSQLGAKRKRCGILSSVQGTNSSAPAYSCVSASSPLNVASPARHPTQELSAEEDDDVFEDPDSPLPKKQTLSTR